MHWGLKVLAWMLGLGFAAALSGLLVLAIVLSSHFPIFQTLPTCRTIDPNCHCAFIRLKAICWANLAKSRRNLTPIKDIPKVMSNAVLAIEDARFYQHGGVDYMG